MSGFMNPMQSEGFDMGRHSKYGDLSHNNMRSFHKSQRDSMRQDFMGKSNKNRRNDDFMEHMSRLTMDFHGRFMDSQGRIVDPGRYFGMEDYMDNDRFFYPHEMSRGRYGMHSMMHGDNGYGSNYHRGMFNDGMYRDMHSYGNMYPGGGYMGRYMMGGPHSMFMQGRYMDDYFMGHHHPGMHFGDGHGTFGDAEGRQGMLNRTAAAEARRLSAEPPQSIQRRLSESHNLVRRLSEGQARVEANAQRKLSRGIPLLPEEKAALETA